MVGCSISLLLMHFHPMYVEAGEQVKGEALRDLVAFLPQMMRLPEGILLMWPVFFTMQRVRGRPTAMTAVEWLWVLSWLGVALLAGLSAWQVWGTLPETVRPYGELPRKLWYIILVPSMAALGLILALVGMIRRVPPPWTHSFGLVLLLWPVGPLLGIVTLGKLVTRTVP
jgi:hypothetical protein